VRIGKLDQVITLQSPSVTNVSGSVTETYSTVATVWGHVITKHGQEAMESARVNAKETIRLMIRYRTDVTNKWRVSWLDQNYNIVNVDRSGIRQGEMWLTCQVVGAL